MNMTIEAVDKYNKAVFRLKLGMVSGFVIILITLALFLFNYTIPQFILMFEPLLVSAIFAISVIQYLLAGDALINE